MSQKKDIGSRVSIITSKDYLKAEISGKIPAQQFQILLVWFFLWTSMGIVVMSQMGSMESVEQRNFFWIYLAFWAYFEFRVGKVLLWRKYGKEVLEYKDQIFTYKIDMPLGARIWQFPLNELKQFVSTLENRSKLTQVYYDSFWVVGGESLALETQRKTLPMGRQLNEEESRKVLSILTQQLRQWQGFR